jgi:hypothetical protein
MKPEDFFAAEFDPVDGSLIYNSISIAEEVPVKNVNDYCSAFPQGCIKVFHSVMNSNLRANFLSQVYAVSLGESSGVSQRWGHSNSSSESGSRRFWS